MTRTLHTLHTLGSALALAHPGPGVTALIRPGHHGTPAVRRAPDGGEDPGREAGMATAEYAIGTLAAAAFAGLLLAIMRSGSLRGVLESLIGSALSVS